jgi:hypothetical protein
MKLVSTSIASKNTDPKVISEVITVLSAEYHSFYDGSYLDLDFTYTNNDK